GGTLAFQQLGDGALTDVRCLTRRPHGEQMRGLLIICQDRSPFERHGSAAMLENLFLKHMGGASERGVNIAVTHGHEGCNIGGKIAVSARRAGSKSSAAIAHSG